MDRAPKPARDSAPVLWQRGWPGRHLGHPPQFRQGGRRRLRRAVGLACLVAAAAGAFAPGAGASISPTLSLDQSAGTTAGSTANLGVDLKFAPAGGDSPDHLTLNLPPGLLANAAIDGGSCLKTADLADAACQVGSGVVTADAYGTIPISTPVTFDLVPPPATGDLAGLAVNSNGSQIGTTADVRVRPSGDPDGVGATINFVLPNSLYGVPISIAEISSTFDGLRYPATCPAPAQSFAATADSYNDPTVHTTAAPLAVTGCSSLAYAPSFAVTGSRDRSDRQAQLTTQVTETANEAPSRSMTLILPYAPLAPNLQSIGLLCPDLSAGTCSPAGSVTASSPLYPTPLTGQAYLTGTLSGLMLTLAFPPPFPLTLSGSVDLTKSTATFTGLPDIPLTNLLVSLSGGTRGLFIATCAPPSGTAQAILTDQNGDRTVDAKSTFTIAGCPGTGGSRAPGSATGGTPQLTNPSLSGLGSGHPALSFHLRVGKHAPKLRALTVILPAGLSFAPHRRGTRGGVRLTGARLGSLSLSHGHLVIRLRAPVSSLGVAIGSGWLRETPALEHAAKHLHSLRLTVIAENAKGKRTLVRVRVNHPGL